MGTTTRTPRVVYGQILGRTASVMHGSRISLGGSRQPKKAIYHPHNLLLLHQKTLWVVCGSQIKGSAHLAIAKGVNGYKKPAAMLTNYELTWENGVKHTLYMQVFFFHTQSPPFSMAKRDLAFIELFFKPDRMVLVKLNGDLIE